MKIFTTIILLTFSSIISYAQTVTVSGNINDEKNKGIPYAFVRDVKHNYATFSDSTGFFKLKADPASSLEVSANNYNSIIVNIDSKSDMSIKLTKGNTKGSIASTLNPGETSVSNGNTFIQNSQLMTKSNSAGGSGNVVTSSTAVKEGFNQEPTRGSVYLYDNWVAGYGINKNDSMVVELSYAYNYNKQTGSIVYTNDGTSLSMVSFQKIKSFSLFDHEGHVSTYENAPAFNNKQFVEVLFTAPAGKIYKKIDTKIVRADFHTDGVVESGHKYDEYVDVARYYFVGADGKPQSISLKKSALKKYLGAGADAVLAAAGSKDIDENFLRDYNKNGVK
jgi:hypothetical protein